MNGFDINEDGLIVNPDGVDVKNFVVPEAKTEQPSFENENYVSPVIIKTPESEKNGTLCLGDLMAYEIFKAKFEHSASTEFSATENNATTENFAAIPEDPGLEPAFC